MGVVTCLASIERNPRGGTSVPVFELAKPKPSRMRTNPWSCLRTRLRTGCQSALWCSSTRRDGDVGCGESLGLGKGDPVIRRSWLPGLPV